MVTGKSGDDDSFNEVEGSRKRGNLNGFVCLFSQEHSFSGASVYTNPLLPISFPT